MSQIYALSACELAARIRSGTITSSEVVNSFVERICQVNPSLNALQQFDPNKIMLEAEKADQAIEQKKTIGRLHGVPITIKDAMHVSGFICSKGCPVFFGKPSTYDATAVARLKAEGAIILGITNTPELLLSYETDNLIFGRTNNPHDLNRTPGGSSGGEAAIIAAGGSPAGIGTDAGGSIRQPAHYAGISAHKPTQGLVPSTGNIPTDGAGIVAQLLSIGPMARHVEDLSLILDIISGADGIDPHTINIDIEHPFKTNLRELRIAYFYNIGSTTPCDDTVKAINNVIDILKTEVYSVAENYPPPLDNVYRLHWETFMLGGAGGELIKQLFKNSEKKMSPSTQAFLAVSEKCRFSVADLRKRLLEVEQYRYDMMKFMRNFDVIISPVSATPAKRHGETINHLEEFTYVMAHNLSGFPSTVIPCGQTASGLPVGVQITSAMWNDRITLAVAHKLQKSLGTGDIPQVSNHKGFRDVPY